MRKSSSMVVGFAVVMAALVEGGMGRLVARAYQSEAVCEGTYSWMDNSQHKSPCLVAAYMIGPCGGTDYMVKQLGADEKYDPGNATTATPCYCSWAVYNLLSACTKCQGGQSGISSWAMWTLNCGSNVATDRPYPANMIPADGTKLPYWASIDPTTWIDARWNLPQAINESNRNEPELTFSLTPTPSKKNNIGPIAGGVVGGVVVVIAAVGITLFLCCRRRRREQQRHVSEGIMGQVHPGQHDRSPSDFSTKSMLTAFGYSQLRHAPSPSTGSASQLPHSPTTFHTHAASIGSLPYESISGSISYAGTPPPNPMITQPITYSGRQNMITPFNMHNNSSSQDSSANDRDRKRADSPGDMADANGLSIGQIASRARVNPPAYSEAPGDRGDFSSQAPDQMTSYGGSTSIMTTPPRRHEKSPSVDSQQSLASSTSAGLWTQANTTSLSGAADVLSQLDSASLPGPPGTNPPYPGPSAVQYRDEKRRPTVMNVTSEQSGEDDDSHRS